MPDRVIVAGALAQQPDRAGHAWVFIHWLHGLRDAGCSVTFVDRMSPDLGDVDRGVEWVRQVMTHADLEGSWSVLLADGTTAGLTRAELIERARGALVVNVMGYLDDDDILSAAERRLFLDLDPGFAQSWKANGLADVLGGHDAFVTVGLNVGKPSCLVPDVGIDWIRTLPPVDVQRWRCDESASGSFTTIGSWRGPFDPIDVDGCRYGLRAHQARVHADLPRRTGARLEAAIEFDSWDLEDRMRLKIGGWSLRDPRPLSRDLFVYRDYVQHSVAEFGIAKQVYVGLRSGWFSDRSACYLASGRAVIVTDTGLPAWMRDGNGIRTYRDTDEAIAAIDEVRADPVRHGRAAREFAEEHLDARRVAQSVLERAA